MSYLPYQLNSFTLLASFKSHVFKQKPQVFDYNVTQFFRDYGLKPPQNYAFKQASYQDLYAEFSKYNEAEDLNISDKYLLPIQEILTSRFLPITSGCNILDISDVVPLITRNTSNGAVIAPVFKYKGDYIDATDDSPICNALVQSYILWKHFYPSIFTVYPKETIAQLDKIIAGKVRSFLISPLDYNICVMRLCCDFNHKLAQTAGTHPIFVGYNIFNGGWHRWIADRKAKGKSWWAIDLSQCDSRVSNQFMWLEQELRFGSFSPEFQTEENHKRLKNFWSDQIYAHVWYDGMILRKQNGNSSGWPNTIQTNSLYLYCVFVYCWLRYNEENYKKFRMAEFDDLVSLMICGDDAVFHFLEDGAALIKYAVELGAIVKLEASVPRDITENSFCSQITIVVNHNGRQFYVPKLDSEKIIASWYLGCKKQYVRLTFARTAQLMVTAVFDNELFEIMSNFMTQLNTNHRTREELQLPVPDKMGTTWDSVRSVWKTRQQILDLYTF